MNVRLSGEAKEDPNILDFWVMIIALGPQNTLPSGNITPITNRICVVVMLLATLDPNIFLKVKYKHFKLCVLKRVAVPFWRVL